MASTRSRPRGREHARPSGGGVAAEHATKIVTITIAGVVVVIAFLALTSTGHVICAATQHFMLFYAGVFALIGLCASVGLGLVATDRMFLQAGRRVFIQSAHRAASFGAVTFLIVHIITEILAQRAHVLDAVVPFLSPFRTFYIGLGTIASDLIILLVITGIMRGRFNASGKAWRWRAIHYTSYASFVFGVWHGLLAGRPGKPYVDWSYGFLVALVLLGLAVRVLSNSLKPKENLSAPPVPQSATSASAPLRAAAMFAQLGAARARQQGGVGVSAGEPLAAATPLGAPVLTALPASAAPAGTGQPYYEPGYEGPQRYLGAPRSTVSGPLPRLDTGTHPVTAAGSRPRYDTGAHARYDTGAQPRYDTGSQPRYDTGAQPRYDTGSQPRYDTGPRRRPDTGSMPRVPTGPLPVVDSGSLPLYASGPMPRVPGGPMQAQNGRSVPTGPFPAAGPGSPRSRTAGSFPAADSGAFRRDTRSFPASDSGSYRARDTGSSPAYDSGPQSWPGVGPGPRATGSRPQGGDDYPAGRGDYPSGRGGLRRRPPGGSLPGADGYPPSGGPGRMPPASAPRQRPVPPVSGPVQRPGYPADLHPGHPSWPEAGSQGWPAVSDQSWPVADDRSWPAARDQSWPAAGGDQSWAARGHDGSRYSDQPPWEDGFPEADISLRHREPGPGMPGYRGSRDHRYGGDVR